MFPLVSSVISILGKKLNIETGIRKVLPMGDRIQELSPSSFSRKNSRRLMCDRPSTPNKSAIAIHPK
ncbi:MAG: hypothetical protein ACKO4R_09205 [Synechococcales cyanobacterium]